MADTKSQRDSGCNTWGHKYGKCIVEFEILSSCRKSLYGKSGGYISDLLAKPIYKVINLGSVYDEEVFNKYFTNPKQACIDNELIGYTLLTSPYEGEIVEETQIVSTDKDMSGFEYIINWFAKYLFKENYI